MKPGVAESEIAVQAVEAARAAGAEAADAYVVGTTTLKLDVRGGQIENLLRASGCGLGLRATLAGRTALVHSTDVTPRALLDLGARAVEITRVLPQPPEAVPLAEPQEIAGLNHPDPDLPREPLPAKIARLAAMEMGVLGVPGVTGVEAAEWTEVEGVIALANSRGVRLRGPVCRIEVGISGFATRKDQTATSQRYLNVPARSGIADPSRLGQEVGEEAVRLLGARRLASIRAPVIFTPRTGWALLAQLAQAMRGDHVLQERSYLAGRRGELIAAPLVSIRDDPRCARGPAQRAFDAEGSPAREVALIERGLLVNYLTDLASARRLGVTAGGNAVRESYAGRVEIGTSNLYMTPGESSPEEIVRATERGLWLTAISGAGAGSSPASEVFSAAATGIWIEKGELAYPVREVSIGGTVREMLSRIDLVGHDLDFTAETQTPTFRVSEMMISGT